MCNPTVSVIFPNNNFQKVYEVRPGDFKFFGQKEPTPYKELVEKFRNECPEGYITVTDIKGYTFECWKGEKRIPLKDIPFTREEALEWEKAESLRYPNYSANESRSYEEYLERNPTYVGIFNQKMDSWEYIMATPEAVIETARLISIKRRDSEVYVKPGLGNPVSSHSKYEFVKGELVWRYEYVSIVEDGSNDYKFYTRLWESISVK